MVLTYQIDDALYLNITNRCSCDCVFCVRQDGDSVGDGDNLWLERDPAASEVIESIRSRDLGWYREVVFCGYGEATERLEVMLEVCRYLKEHAPSLPVRLNTNGLSDLVNGPGTAARLEGLVDVASISLNAPNAARYREISRPRWGEEAFPAILRFARECKRYVPRAVFTLVDVLEPGEVEACQALADREGIPLRVRQKW